jgi:hypothetical protein
MDVSAWSYRLVGSQFLGAATHHDGKKNAENNDENNGEEDAPDDDHCCPPKEFAHLDLLSRNKRYVGGVAISSPPFC